MKVGVLGTGIVGQTFAVKLSELGHEVMVGTRNVEETLARTLPDVMGYPPFSVWYARNPSVKLGAFADAAAHGEILFNVTNGLACLNALTLAGAANLRGKALLDISNALDFSRGMPPTLAVCNTDSLGEQIQRAFPEAKVVKTLNTMNCNVMVNPRAVANGDHTVFVSGNDADAKAQVTDVLKNWFGWEQVMDLGDITTARGVEMYFALWFRVFSPVGTPMFNVKIVK